MNFIFTRILVVDDDESMRTFIDHSLRRIGIQHIETCHDGASAMQLLKSFKPDLALIDIHMEPMSGFDLVQAMRKHPDANIRGTKVIFMSVDSSLTTLQASLPHGSFAYLVKPPLVETLLAKLELAFSTHVSPVVDFF
jgi:CheY-like chemotaxis protein